MALFSCHSINASNNKNTQDRETLQECRAGVSEFFQDHTFEFDVQLKSGEQQTDLSDQKRIQKLYFHSFSIITLFARSFDDIEIPKGIIPLCFSKTDIIYPFHFFW